MTKIVKIDFLIMVKTAENHTLSGRIHTFIALIKVQPPGYYTMQ